MKKIHIEEVPNPDKKIDDEDDYIVKSIGAFGRWQFILCFVVSLSRLIALWNLLSIFFLTATTDFKCVRFQNYTLLLTTNETFEAESSVCYEDCIEYTYTQSVFERTLIAEFGLICDRKWMVSFLQTILMFGLVVGVSLFGWTSDRFGRSKTIYMSTIINICLMFGIAFSPNYWIFVTFRFFIGLATGGIMASTTVYISETVGPEVKDLTVNLALGTDQISIISLALFAYLAPTWRWYQIQYTSISVIILVGLLFIPETPRWLIATKKPDEAVTLLIKAARYNGRCINGIKENITKSIEALKTKDQPANLTYSYLFRNRHMALKTISSVVVWFVTGSCYFGITQYVTLLGSNIFLVVPAMGLLQIPSIPITILVTKKLNRRISTISSLIIVAAAMIVLIFIPEGTWASTIIAIFGACAINSTFLIIYIYVVELYATPVRNMGFGINTASSKVGAMLAPFIANLKPHWVASLIFAILALIAVGFCLLLPETKGQKLRDDLDE